MKTQRIQTVLVGFAFLTVMLSKSATVNGALLDGKVLSVALIHKGTETDQERLVRSPDFVVGPGVEVMDFGLSDSPPLPPLVDIDLSDRNILITAVQDQTPAFQEILRFIGDPNSFSFFPAVKNVLVNPATNWAGFTQSRVFLSGVLDVDLSQLSGLQGQVISLDLIPEPAGASLLLTALFATGMCRPRQSQS